MKVQRVKKIMKKAENSSQPTTSYGEYRPTSYTATPSYYPDFLKTYNEPLFSGYAGSYKPTDIDLRVNDSPMTETYINSNANVPFKIGDYE